MKKIICIILLSFLVVGMAKAQFGIGLTFGPQIPVNDSFATNYKTGIGFLVSPHFYKNGFSIGGSVGYARWAAKRPTTNYTYSARAYPFYITGEFDLGRNEKLKPVLGVDLGLVAMSIHVRYLNPWQIGQSTTQTKAFFVGNAYLGLNYWLGKNVGLHGNLKINYGYRGTENELVFKYFLTFGINAGLVFRFNPK